MFKKFFLAVFFTVNVPVLAKVLIITHSYNRPDFIAMQSRSFKRFLKDSYEFVVFSDATNETMDQAIRDACICSQVTYRRVPQEIHDRPYLPRLPGDPFHRPNIRHANGVQYAMDTLGFDHDGPVMVLDSDMFLVRPLSIVEELNNYDIITKMAGADNGVYHLWGGFMIFAMDRLPNKRTLNFNCGMVNGASADSGGHTYYYLKAHPTLRIKTIQELFGYQLFCPDRFAAHLVDMTTPVDQQIIALQSKGFNEREIQFLQKKPHTISFLCNHCFLHYRAGSNYDGQSVLYDQQKMRLINMFLHEVFQGESAVC